VLLAHQQEPIPMSNPGSSLSSHDVKKRIKENNTSAMKKQLMKQMLLFSISTSCSTL
jgi:hypothetical protein